MSVQQVAFTPEHVIAELERVADPDALYAQLRPFLDTALSLIESAIREGAPQGASGELGRAVTHATALHPDGVYGNVFIQPESPAFKYAFYVEFGRGPGKMPPVEAIIPWVRFKLATKAYEAYGNSAHENRLIAAKRPRPGSKKRKSEDKAVASIAFLIARKIGLVGTEAQMFFDRGFKRASPEAERIIQHGMEVVLKRVM